MEMCIVVLSVPFCFVAAAVYGSLLRVLVSDRPRLRAMVFLASVGVLVCLIAEVVVLRTLGGAVRTRALLGPGFTMAHTAMFLLSVPSLASILVLQDQNSWLRRWYVAAAFCSILGFCVLAMQYSVMEALFGVDGVGGPYPGPW